MSYFEEIGAWGTESLAKAYAIGFLLSLLLTFESYFLAVHHALSPQLLAASLLGLAALQFVIQVFCFLHVTEEKASRERLVILVWTGVMVLIIGIGSLWIMSHLNQRMMEDPALMEQYMQNQIGM